MDPLSHALVGGTCAALRCKRAEWLRPAAACGIIAGMFPDIDIVIRSADNPMLGLGYHRHFTHALAFAPFGALVVAGFLWPFLRKTLPFTAIYLFCLLGMSMHGILDAMTNYGTHLFWPFTDRRESWSIISIIDPIFTLTLFICLFTAVMLKAKRMVMAGACFALLYWSFGWYQRSEATETMTQLIADRKHTAERYEVKPSLGNLFAWRGQYLHEGRIYIDGYHISPWRRRVIYVGDSLPLFSAPPELQGVQRRDLDFFMFFSDGWVAKHPDDPSIIGDARFSMLPNGTTPLWGIRLRPESPDLHVTFHNTRARREGDVEELLAMIRGE